MIFLFFIVMSLIASIYFCYLVDTKTEFDDDTLLTFAMVLIVIIGAFLGYMVEKTIYNNSEKIEIAETLDTISSISDYTRPESSVYLFTYGSRDSYAFRYVSEGKFGKQIKEIKNSSSVYVLETDEKEPSIIRYSCKLENKILSFLIFEYFYSEGDRTEIVVPKGSISEGYEINLN